MRVFPMVLHPLGFQVAEQTGILDAYGHKTLRLGLCGVSGRPQGPMQAVRADPHLRNLTLTQLVLEVTIR